MARATHAEDGGRQTRPDVTVSGGFGMYEFRLHSAKARRWARKHVADPIWLDSGRSFPVDDRRYAMDIAAAMLRARLRVK